MTTKPTKLLFDSTLEWLDDRAREFNRERAALDHWLSQLKKLAQSLPTAAASRTARPAEAPAALCHVCGDEVSSTARFCTRCGARRCQHCQHFTPRGKFCNQCGGLQS